MADTSTQSIQIHAPLARVAAVICDFPRYPDWAESIKLAEVVEEYEDGYAAQVRFQIDATVLVDEYTLEYAYADDLSRIEWHLIAPSKTQRSQDGFLRPGGDRRRHDHGDVFTGGGSRHRHARHVPPQSGKSDHGYGVEGAQAPCREPAGGLSRHRDERNADGRFST